MKIRTYPPGQVFYKPYAADYNLFSNRLHIWVYRRDDKPLSPEDYTKIKSIPGMVYWGGRSCFTCLWSPEAEDLITQHFGMEIVEKDDPDDVEGRTSRFARYADNNEEESKREAEYIRSGRANTERRIRLASNVLERKSGAAAYWHDRIARSISHAQFKEDPGLIRRQIKGLEKDHRKWGRELAGAYGLLTAWDDENITREKALKLDNLAYTDGGVDIRDKEKLGGAWDLGDAIEKETLTPAQARDLIIPVYQEYILKCTRWIEHLDMQMEFKRNYLGADAAEPEVIHDDRKFKIGLWVTDMGTTPTAYRITSNSQDSIRVNDNTKWAKKVYKPEVSEILTYEQVVRRGIKIGSTLEDAFASLKFDKGMWVVTTNIYHQPRYYKIVGVRGRTNVQVDSGRTIMGESHYVMDIRKADVTEVITEEEAKSRMEAERKDAEEKRLMLNREGKYSE